MIKSHCQADHSCVNFHTQLGTRLNMPQSQLLEQTDFFCIASTSSTQDEIHQLQQPARTACLARQQTHGRGRRGNSWYSPKDHHLYLSYGDHTELSLTGLQGLNCAIAMSTCQAIESVVNLPEVLSIKWPNDIYYQNKKLAGLLLESEPSKKASTYVIVGCGININANALPELDQQSATSLNTIVNEHKTAVQIDFEELAQHLIHHWQVCLLEFQTRGLESFLPRWQQRDLLFQRSIHFRLRNNQHSGHAQGIDQNGHLIVKQNQQVTAYCPDEISLIRPDHD